MKRAVLIILILSASLLGSGCIRPAGSSSYCQSKQSGPEIRYEVGVSVGVENMANLQGLLSGRASSNGFEPPDRWMLKWMVWPMSGKAEGPFDAKRFGFSNWDSLWR